MFQRIIKLEYEFPNGFPECPKALVEQLLVSNTSAVNFTSIKVCIVFSMTPYQELVVRKLDRAIHRIVIFSSAVKMFKKL